MRRPRFKRWIRTEVLRVAQTQKFSLRKLAAQAQRGNDELAAALLLYAHENDQLGKLDAYIYDDALRQEYQSVESRFSKRSIERLALRGTPMQSLPETYRVFLDRYEQAYHTPERTTAEKRTLREHAHRAMLESGISPAEISRALGLDAANLHAYLVRGETHRFTLDTAQRINAYVS